jgi:excisionase family DNA binding protein
VNVTSKFRSPQEVANELGVDIQTIRRWIHAGRLKAYKPGKEYRIRESDLEEFLRAREVRPKVPAPSPYEPTLLNGLEEQRRRGFDAGKVTRRPEADEAELLAAGLLGAIKRVAEWQEAATRARLEWLEEYLELFRQELDEELEADELRARRERMANRLEAEAARLRESA